MGGASFDTVRSQEKASSFSAKRGDRLRRHFIASCAAASMLAPQVFAHQAHTPSTVGGGLIEAAEKPSVRKSARGDPPYMNDFSIKDCDDSSLPTGDGGGVSEEPVFLRLIRQKKFVPFLNVLRKGKYDINMSSSRSDGYTALQFAILADAPKIVKAILEVSGIDVNALARCGDAALHVAVDAEEKQLKAREGSKQLGPTPLELLLAEPSINVNVRDQQGRVPLHHAIISDAHSAFLKLVERDDVDLEARDATAAKFSLLEMAIVKNRWRMVRELLQRGARVDTLTTDGKPPLHLALRIGDAPTVCALLEGIMHKRQQSNVSAAPVSEVQENDASAEKSPTVAVASPDDPVNAADSDGNTPLHLAAECGQARIVAAILKAGGDPRLRNRSDLTPYDVASRAKDRNKTMLKLLSAAMQEHSSRSP